MNIGLKVGILEENEKYHTIVSDSSELLYETLSKMLREDIRCGIIDGTTFEKIYASKDSEDPKVL
jgi:hypothetical protein